MAQDSSATPATRRQLKEGKAVHKDVRSLLARGRKRLAPQQVERIQSKLDELQRAIKERAPGARLETLMDETGALADAHLAFARKSTLREYAESIGTALAIALFLRFFVVEAFKIPSGSMVPTLVVGDHIFVNKFLYGIRVPLTERWLVHFSEPKRGDIIVFMYPEDRDKDFIKRVIGVPGDTVEIRDGELVVTDAQGQIVPLTRRVVDPDFLYVDEGEEGSGARMPSVESQEVIDGHTHGILHRKAGPSMRSFGPVKVHPDHVFVMGDNRDNSHDSRFWGQVPYDLIKGKALIIWYSGAKLGRVGTLVE